MNTRGFTLIELLVVMVLLAVLVGLVSISTTATPERQFRAEVARLAVVLSAAREEAQVLGRPIRLEIDPQGYRFLERRDDVWRLVMSDDVLKPRTWRVTVKSVTLDTQGVAPQLEFGREAIDAPFVLTVRGEDYANQVRGDGVGGFEVP